MVVVSLTDCPAKIRGDMTKWLFEINTGVFVGKISARIREELWKRICENLPQGKATMVYGAANEQGIEFKVHNTTWRPVDFDGITLMLRPFRNEPDERSAGRSKAAQFIKARRILLAKQKRAAENGLVFVDVETDGLSSERNNIIEIGAIRVVGGEIADRFSVLVKTNKDVPKNVRELTGVTAEDLELKGKPLPEAIRKFVDFIGESRLIFYNAAFDLAFLRAACKKCGIQEIKNPYKDVLILAKRSLDDVKNYKLDAIVRYFGNETKQKHRALDDCELTLFAYNKLNEI